MTLVYLNEENKKKRKWRETNDLSMLEGDGKLLGNRHPHFEYTL